MSDNRIEIHGDSDSGFNITTRGETRHLDLHAWYAELSVSEMRTNFPGFDTFLEEKPVRRLVLELGYYE